MQRWNGGGRTRKEETENYIVIGRAMEDKWIIEVEDR